MRPMDAAGESPERGGAGDAGGSARRRGRLGLLALGGLLVLASAPARGGDRSGDAFGVCDRDTRLRLHFLEDRLEHDRVYADRWWKAWNLVFVGGIVVDGTRAGFEHDKGERANLIVEVAKSGLGLVQNLAAPPIAREGARETLGMETRSQDDCALRLAHDEAILRAVAARSHHERRSWESHVANLALNVAGALIVAEGFHEGSGWSSGAIGAAVGEIQIWSYPWQARDALEEYERRFPGDGVVRAPRRSWRLESLGAGARLVLRW
jgi:hypothetical protein